MMLTGAHEGFVVTCHRHRDQAHGNCSGFRLEVEGRKMLVCNCLYYLAARDRVKEIKVILGGMEEIYPFLPFHRFVGQY